MADVEGTIDRGVVRLRRELEQLLNRQMEEVERLFRRLQREGGTAERLAIARAVADKLADQVEALGSTLASDYRRLASEVVAEVGAELREWEIPDEMSAPAVTTLQAQLGGTVDDISTIAGEGAAELRQAILEMARTTRTPAEALDAVRGAMGSTLAQAITTVDTGVAGLDRSVSLIQASDTGFTWFLYDGPLDSITRPFCAAHVGKRHTQEQVAALTNDTGPQPASVYGGGFQCRHRWVALDESELGDYPAWSG